MDLLLIKKKKKKLKMTMVSVSLSMKSQLKARGSIPVDTHYLDEQIEEKRLRDAQLAQQEKQQGG